MCLFWCGKPDVWVSGPALLPGTSFWAYFASTFAAALVVFVFLIPKIEDGSLFILTTILAFVAAPLIQGRFQEKARKTAQYQDVVQQRHEKLCALENKQKLNTSN